MLERRAEEPAVEVEVPTDGYTVPAETESRDLVERLYWARHMILSVALLALIMSFVRDDTLSALHDPDARPDAWTARVLVSPYYQAAVPVQIAAVLVGGLAALALTLASLRLRTRRRNRRT